MTDYLELLLDAQEQEEPEEDTQQFELRFFSAVPGRTRTGKKSPSSVQAELEPPPTRAEKEAETEGPTLLPAAGEPSALPASRSGLRKAKRAHAWMARDGTAGVDMDMDINIGMAKASQPAETAGIEAADRETDAPGSVEAGTLDTWMTGAGAFRAQEAGAGKTSHGAGAAEADVTDTDAVETVGLETAGSQAAGAGIAGALAALRQQERALSGGTGSAVDSGAPSLYRQMTRTGQAVGSLRQSAQVLTVPESNSAAPGPGAAELDELFSRDARRYDGGFSLF